jgi:hypothetical protein
VQLNFSARDFTSLEEGWRVKFLEPDAASTYRYSLSSWLQFSPSTMLLTPGQSGSIQVNIRGRSLSGGGHYASVIADITAAPPPARQAVDIKSQLVSLVFVRAQTGFEREEGKINQFSAVNPGFFSPPQNYVLRFENSGNTYLTPHGLVIIRDFLGREISRGILNTDSLITLPESVRRYDIPVTVRQTTWLLPGPYQASLTVNYGDTSQTITSHLQFLSLGSRLNLIILIFVLLSVLAVSRLLLKKMKRRQKPGP